MRRLPEILLLAVCVASAWAYSALPPIVASDASWLLPFASLPARSASRALAAFMIPITLVILLAAYRWSVSPAGRAASGRTLPSWLGKPAGHEPEYEKFSGSLDLMMLCVIALTSALHLGLLATSLGWTGPVATLVGVVNGVCLGVMGNVMPRLRPNAIAGMRTAAMLGDAVAWRNAHATFGRTWVAGGAVVIATALLAPRYAMVAFVAAVAVSIVLAPIVSRRALARSTRDDRQSRVTSG